MHRLLSDTLILTKKKHQHINIVNNTLCYMLKYLQQYTSKSHIFRLDKLDNLLGH